MGILCSKLQKKSNKYSSTTTTPSSPFSNKSEVNRSLSDLVTTTPSAFPLLKLPLLVIDEVLKEMDILAQIQLYSLSNKTKGILQSSIKRNSSKDLYNLEVLFEYDEDSMELQLGSNAPLIFKFESNDERDLEFIHSSSSYLKLEDIVVPVNVDYETYTITTYWNNKTSGFKDLLLYFCKIFNPIIFLHFKNELNIYKAHVGIFPNVRIWQSLLKLSVKKLVFLFFPKECVHKTWNEPLKIDELYILSVQQINIWDILQVKKIIIMSEIMKDQELNTLLKKWITSEFRVEHLRLAMNNPHLESIVEGLSTKPVRKACVDGIFKEFEDGKCFGIQKSDGRKAIIYSTKIGVNLEITSY